VAKSTLYGHWPAVDDLMLDAIRWNMPEVSPPPPSVSFEEALRQVVDDVVASLAAPEWRRILPALLSLQYHSPELAEALAADREDKVALMDDLLRRGVAEGVVPEGIDPLMLLDVMIGPLVLAALSGRVESLQTTAGFVVERVLASYSTTAV
jgi:AcrR family transcriptional regulator